MTIAPYTVDYHLASGTSMRSNPLPARAMSTRAADPKSAAHKCGLGRLSWDVITSYTKKDITAFAKRLELGSMLAGNAKTVKPRPSGRLGVIKGLALVPHFYPNLLNMVDLKPSGALQCVDRRWFYAFNGRDRNTAAEMINIDPKDMLTFCAGSSPYCRQTCLVTTGQNPSTKEAAHAKMKYSYALLSEPELYVALLRQQISSFGKNARKKGFDAVVRLNMLSDIPWYAVCPELIEDLSELVTFYDYTKIKYWGTPEYERVRDLLDLTFSYSGSNDTDCAEALQAGERVAVAFAPANPERSVTIQYRTTWEEILSSGLVNENQEITDLFGDGGAWPIVDGDDSDYRIDDPKPAIVALNFKRPNIKEEDVPHLAGATRESRAHFTKHVPDEEGLGIAYAAAKAKVSIWKNLYGKDYKDAIKGLSVRELLNIVHEWETGEPTSPYDIPDMPKPVPEDLVVAMAPVEGTNLLVGPHVLAVAND